MGGGGGLVPPGQERLMARVQGNHRALKRHFHDLREVESKLGGLKDVSSVHPCLARLARDADQTDTIGERCA